MTVDAVDPTGLGRVLRNEGGTVERIVEDKDATDEERSVSEINAGLYAIDAAWLRRRIGDLLPSPATGELYLTDLVRFAREDGRLVAALEVEDDGRLTGINDRSQLARAEWDMRVEVNDRWMQAGVTMVDPSTVYLDHGVELAAGRRAGAERRSSAARRPDRRADAAIGAGVADRRLARSAPTARLGERHRAVDRRGRTSRSARSATSGRASHVGARRGDRQLRRAQEHAASASACASTT